LEWLHLSKPSSYITAYSNQNWKDIPVMTDDEKKTEPLKPFTPDILRKMVASGKSLPSGMSTPEERDR
jgi:hypothetical protein